MKKQILLAIGMAGLFSGQPLTQAQASVHVGVNVPGGPSIFFSDRPDFVYLQDYGYSVSYGAPYDVIYFGNDYFVFRDGDWFRSRDYRGPWMRIRSFELPPPIRHHRIEDIRRFRDMEYRRHDRGFWNDRFRHDRDEWRGHDMRRDRFYDRRGPDDRRGPNDHRGPDDRRGPDFDRR